MYLLCMNCHVRTQSTSQYRQYYVGIPLEKDRQLGTLQPLPLAGLASCLGAYMYCSLSCLYSECTKN